MANFFLILIVTFIAYSVGYSPWIVEPWWNENTDWTEEPWWTEDTDWTEETGGTEEPTWIEEIIKCDDLPKEKFEDTRVMKDQGTWTTLVSSDPYNDYCTRYVYEFPVPGNDLEVTWVESQLSDGMDTSYSLNSTFSQDMMKMTVGQDDIVHDYYALISKPGANCIYRCVDDYVGYVACESALKTVDQNKEALLEEFNEWASKFMMLGDIPIVSCDDEDCVYKEEISLH